MKGTGTYSSQTAVTELGDNQMFSRQILHAMHHKMNDDSKS